MKTIGVGITAALINGNINENINFIFVPTKILSYKKPRQIMIKQFCPIHLTATFVSVIF